MRKNHNQCFDNYRDTFWEKQQLSPVNNPLCEVSLQNIIHNVEIFRNVVGGRVQIMGVVKADAYGHGACEVAKCLEKHDVDIFGVATCQEGVELRNNGIKGTILVLIPLLPTEMEEAVENDLSISLGSNYEAALLNRISFQLNRKAKAHLMVDTCLSRGGFHPEELRKSLPEISGWEAVEINGIWTHFASLESLTSARTIVESFSELVSYAQRFLQFRFIHAANTHATTVLPESHFNLVRPGLGLYGYLPAEKNELPLQPVMRLTAPVISLKRYKAGTGVSYESTHVLKKTSTIATIRFGYADGYNFNLGNSSEVMIRNKRYPIVGRIMMDQLLVTVGDDKITIGDRAILIGSSGPSPVELASKAKVSPHTILATIGKRVERVYLRGHAKTASRQGSDSVLISTRAVNYYKKEDGNQNASAEGEDCHTV